MTGKKGQIDKDLLDKISDLISKGSEHGYNYLQSTYYDDNSEGDPYEEYKAENYLYSAWRHLITALELIDFQFLYSEAKILYEDFKKEPLNSATGPEEPYLIWPYKIEEFLKVVRTFESSRNSGNGLFDLKKILSNCETFITDAHLFSKVPSEEADVHDRIEGLLKCYFSDLQRKPPLGHSIKNFIPDTGIGSIQTFIEYKYVTNREDCKLALEEIYADINGYQHDIFENILFVIYETNRCFLESEWESSLKKLETKMNCDFVLLKGSPPTGDKNIRTKTKNKASNKKRRISKQ